MHNPRRRTALPFPQTPRRDGGAVTVNGHLAKLNEVLVCFYTSFALVLSCAVSLPVCLNIRVLQATGNAVRAAPVHRL
jgi:hypothetical protein